MSHVISGNVDPGRIVYPEFDLEFARKFYNPLARGEELTTELLAMVPDPYYVKRPDRGGVPEIFGENLRVWTIKDSVKKIIEELEQRIHTFIPVNLRIRGSEDDHGRYFLLYPGQAINAVVIEQTDFAEGKGYAGLAISRVLSPFGDTVLDPALVAGRHLWRGARAKIGESVPFSHDLFCSDELAERIEGAGVEGWRFRRCKSPSLHS